ncbi:MAG TPA: hypothetical protein VKA38_03065 [Draconibacterium sp.]|nr:hypothetical protein [Draconibacterium sp.]
MFTYINNYPKDRENGWSNELQGVSNDGINWYFSQKEVLWKFPVAHDLNSKITKSDPSKGILKVKLNMQGYNHFGDLDYHDGKLFVPVEGGPVARIAIFDANDLSLICFSNINVRNAPWCAVNPNDGFIYTSVFSEVNFLIAYHYEIMNDGNLILTPMRQLFLYDESGNLMNLDRIQGGAFSKQNNLLYLVCDAHNSSNGIYVIDTVSGKKTDKIHVDYDPTSFGFTAEELEGITIWDLDNSTAPNVSGQLHLVMIDNVGTGDDDLYFKHYKAQIEKQGATLPQPSGQQNIIFNYLGNYPKERDNGWSEELNGVTHDDNNWFFTQRNRLWKFPVSHDLKIKTTSSAPESGILNTGIPQELSSLGYDHCGDLSYHEGFLFIPITGGSSPVIAAFKATDLSLVAFKALNQFSGIGWCAVNSLDECIYTSDKHLGGAVGDQVSPIVCFKINMELLKNQNKLELTEVKKLVLKNSLGTPINLKHMQGGTFDFENHLYLMNGYVEDFNEKDGGISVYDVNTGFLLVKSKSGSGNFNYEFHPGWSKYEEPEGLTYWDLNDGKAPNIKGVLHAIMLDNDLFGDDFYFKHYDKIIIDEGNINTFPDLDKIFIANTNPQSTEVHQRFCSWADNISIEHIKYYGSLQKALDDGFDGCYYCLRKYHTR